MTKVEYKLIDFIKIISRETGKDITKERVIEVLKKEKREIPSSIYKLKINGDDIDVLARAFKWKKDLVEKLKNGVFLQGDETNTGLQGEEIVHKAEELREDNIVDIDLDLDIDIDLDSTDDEENLVEGEVIEEIKIKTEEKETTPEIKGKENTEEATLKVEEEIKTQEEKAEQIETEVETQEEEEENIPFKIVGKIDLAKSFSRRKPEKSKKPKKEKKDKPEKREKKYTIIKPEIPEVEAKKEKEEEDILQEVEKEEKVKEEVERVPEVVQTKEAKDIGLKPQEKEQVDTQEKHKEERVELKQEKEGEDIGIKIVGKIEIREPYKQETSEKTAKNKEKEKEKSETKQVRKDKPKKKRRRIYRVVRKVVLTEEEKKEDKRKQEAKVLQNIKETTKQLHKKTKKQKQRARREKRKLKQQKQLERLAQESKKIRVTEFITVGEFASLLGVPVNQVIMKCLELGYMVNINHRMERDLMEILADEFGKEIEFINVEEAFEVEDDVEVDESQLVPRPPVVTVMGHVDHGKTSLLDYIRKTNVVAGEAGGITQSIGAYSVTLEDGRKITFIDTPGHEDFSNMRARGAKVTDVVIIVIAADDEVKQQTEEALAHASNAGVPIVFAINKIDKPEVTPEKINKIKQQLAERGYLVEEWGGDYLCQEISAKTGQGVDELLELVLLVAEELELKANPNAPAKGTVLEAALEQGKGAVANVLIQDGTLRVGDPIIAGAQYGRVRAMFDERHNRVKEAGPSTPVQILGLKGVPEAGDQLRVTKSEKEAKEVALKRQQILREQRLRKVKSYTLQAFSDKAQGGEFDTLRVIVKADNRGSLEAITQSLLKLSTEEVAIDIVMASVGPVSESDVNLATTANAIIVSFNARPTPRARKLAEERGIEIRHYNIIYKLIEDIKNALSGLLKPTIEEKVIGTAEVRKIFRVPKVGTVAGCMVVDGVIKRNAKVRVVRNGVDIYDGEIFGLKRFKDDVKEVPKGYECGISIKNFNDIKEGDLIEAYELVEKQRSIEEVKKLYDI